MLVHRSTTMRHSLRDFRHIGVRALLVVFAIALGIAAFTAVLSSYAILTRTLNDSYLATEPASATLRLDTVDDALLAQVRSVPGVAAAEARRTVTGRIRTGAGRWRNAVLFVAKDYATMRIGKLAHERGTWPPQTGEMAIERDAFQIADAQLGETVRLKIGWVEQPVRITGGVHDVGQAQARMENLVYCYIHPDTLKPFGQDPTLNELKILVSGDRFSEPHISEVVGRVQAVLQSAGNRVRRVDIPTPGEHPHAKIMGLLLLIMASFGLAILALSGVLVINLMAALMAARVREIGVMKAIGATRGQIARIYLLQAALLGVLAIHVGLPLGYFGSVKLCEGMSALLNFDVTRFAAPGWVYLSAAIVGLALPLLSAWIPVWSGTSVSVHSALTNTGAGSDHFGATAFDRALAGVGGLSRPILLSVRNSFRCRERLALTAGTLALAGTVFLCAINVRTSLVHTLDRLFAPKRYDISVVLDGMQQKEKVESIVRSVPNVGAAESWIVTDASLSGAGKPLAADGGASMVHGGDVPAANRFTVMALPADSALLQLNIVEGRGLRPGDTDAMVINSAASANLPGMKVGQTVMVRIGATDVPWRIVGISKEVFSPSTAYVPLAFFEQHGHKGTTNSLRIALKQTQGQAVPKAMAAIDDVLEHNQLRAQPASSKADSRYSFDQHLLMIYVFLIAVAILIAGVGGLGLTTTIAIGILERRRELGIMRAMGAAPSTVSLLVIFEGLAIGAMSWGLACLAAWPVSRALAGAMVTFIFSDALDFQFGFGGVVIWLAVSLILGAVASAIPAWHASRTTVREALTLN